MAYIESAFNEIVKDAKVAGRNYVCLMENVPYYGGPEEGGWWGSDSLVRAYQEFATDEEAEAVAEKVRKLAADLEADEQRSYGDHCARTMEWLDERGLDADFLPEPDGPSKFYVGVFEELPTNQFGSRHYE